MRELKFRQPIYDRKGKFYHFEYWGRLGPQDEYDEKCFKGPASASTMVSKPDEQFTGLHDKNGKEIYEGDIITLGEKNKACLVVWDNERGAFCAIINNTAIRMHVDFWKSGKIIGNIHENPELLAAKE